MRDRRFGVEIHQFETNVNTLDIVSIRSPRLPKACECFQLMEEAKCWSERQDELPTPARGYQHLQR